MKINNKILFWFLIIAIIPSGITGFFGYQICQDMLKKYVYNQLSTTADGVHGRIHEFIEIKRERIVDFSSDGFIRDNTEEIGYYGDTRNRVFELSNYLARNKMPLDPDILETFVTDMYGKIVASSNPQHNGLNRPEEDYFTGAKKNDVYVTKLHQSIDADEPVIEVSRLLRSRDKGVHRPVGTIVNRIKGSSIAGLLVKDITNNEEFFVPDSNLTTYIVNRNNQVVAGSNVHEGKMLEMEINTEPISKFSETGGEMIGVYQDHMGNEVFGVSVYDPHMDWIIIVEEDVSTVFADMKYLRDYIIMMRIITVFIVVLLAIYISRTLTSPIKSLLEGTKRISRGDLKEPIPIDEMNGEIKDLGKAMNMMMESLRNSTRENKHLFKLVKKSRDEWRKTFDAIDDIIVIHDRDHRITMSNRAFYERFKLDRSELFNKNCHEIFHGMDSSCPFERSINSSKLEPEIVNDPHLGGTFLVSTYPLKDDGGEIYAYVHLAKDITLQKELQAELIVKAGELEKVNKELEDFVYLASHYLKEPLFVISGYASRLSKAYYDVYDEKGRKYIDRIKANTMKMDQQIHEIMEVLRTGKIEYNHEDSDSFVIVNDVINALDERIMENEIKISINDDLPTIHCDAARIKDVFSNLITNAIKFMGNGSHTVPCYSKSSEFPLNFPDPSLSKKDKVAVNTQLRNITIGCKREESYYKFFVEDTGIGIQKNHQDQIFKIFSRLKDVDTEGTGVGLAIVKKIIERHKGNIWVESPVCDGRGSRFCFTIPI